MKRLTVLLIATLFALFSAGVLYAGDDNISGTLTMDEDTMVLKSSSGTYTLIGKALPSSLVGKKVRINGTILESEDEDEGSGVISVDSFEEMK